MSKDRFRTYLAGAFCPYEYNDKEYTDWRDFVKEKLNNKKIILHDPRFQSNQLCPATFAMDDLNGVLSSDIILHYRTNGYEDEGASWEHGIAFGYNKLLQNRAINKPITDEKLIIYADDTKVMFPLHFASATLTFGGLEKSVEFLNKLKSTKKCDFMKDYMKLLDGERNK